MTEGLFYEDGAREPGQVFADLDRERAEAASEPGTDPECGLSDCTARFGTTGWYQTPGGPVFAGHEHYVAGTVLYGKSATLAALRRLGYRDTTAVHQAIEHASFTRPEDGPCFLAHHSVIRVQGSHQAGHQVGYQIIGHNPPVISGVPSWLPARDSSGDDPRGRGWPELGEGWDVSEILHAIQIIDYHLDADAPEIYRLDHPASRLANMYRRISAGPASEGQEAVDALNLATGGNPRKGVQGDIDTILGELGDTASAALLAIQSVTKDTDVTWAVLTTALAKALSRVPRERPAPTSGYDPGNNETDA